MDQPPPNATAKPLNWSALGFHPLGLYDLRRRLGTPRDAFEQYRARFEAADVAWFAAGLASLPCDIQADEFYPELHEMRNNTTDNGTEVRKALRKRVLDVTFDCAALLDRAFGSTTLVIHVPGTTRPNSKKQEDYVKAKVYFPGHLAREDERYSIAVHDIVQRFIKDIGIPTIARYEYCASFYWSMPPSKDRTPPYSRQGIQPAARPAGSSTFTYHGTPSKASVVVVDDDDEEIATLRQALVDREKALKVAQRREAVLLSEIENLKSSLSSFAPPSAPSMATAPLMPDRAKSNVYQAQYPKVSSFTREQVSVAATGSGGTAAGGVRTPAPPKRRGLGVGGSNSTTPTKTTDPGIAYRDFIRANHLEDNFFLIEKIRRKTAKYLWHMELAMAGIAEDVAEKLVSLMSLQPSEQE